MFDYKLGYTRGSFAGESTSGQHIFVYYFYLQYLSLLYEFLRDVMGIVFMCECPVGCHTAAFKRNYKIHISHVSVITEFQEFQKFRIYRHFVLLHSCFTHNNNISNNNKY